VLIAVLLPRDCTSHGTRRNAFVRTRPFGLGDYGRRIGLNGLVRRWPGGSSCATAVRARRSVLFGCLRWLYGVYLAMLTLAFAQDHWAATFQWEPITADSNGIIGVWRLSRRNRAGSITLLALALTVTGVLLLRHLLFSQFG